METGRHLTGLKLLPRRFLVKFSRSKSPSIFKQTLTDSKQRSLRIEIRFSVKQIHLHVIQVIETANGTFVELKTIKTSTFATAGQNHCHALWLRNLSCCWLINFRPQNILLASTNSSAFRKKEYLVSQLTQRFILPAAARTRHESEKRWFSWFETILYCWLLLKRVGDKLRETTTNFERLSPLSKAASKEVKYCVLSELSTDLC